MAAYTRETQQERHLAGSWSKQGSYLERERGRETEVEMEVKCALALLVTTHLKFRFIWDVNSLGSELKQ